MIFNDQFIHIFHFLHLCFSVRCWCLSRMISLLCSTCLCWSLSMMWVFESQNLGPCKPVTVSWITLFSICCLRRIAEVFFFTAPHVIQNFLHFQMLPRVTAKQTVICTVYPSLDMSTLTQTHRHALQFSNMPCETTKGTEMFQLKLSACCLHSSLSHSAINYQPLPNDMSLESQHCCSETC